MYQASQGQTHMVAHCGHEKEQSTNHHLTRINETIPMIKSNKCSQQHQPKFAT